MRLTFDDYILDVARRELWHGCEPVVVEPQVFDLLAYLVQHPERVVTKDELLQAVWDGRIVSESAITNRINAARRAIGDSGEKQRLIRTVPRKGFRFIGAIKKEAVESPKEAVPQGSGRRHGIPAAFAAAVSGLLGAAIAAFLLWPGYPWVSAIGTDSARRPTTVSAGDLRPPVAVLPLTALGNSTDQPNLAAGLTEDLTTELSRGGLLVTSRATTSAFLGRTIDAAQIGRELGVRYIVDGSVEQASGEIRVTVRLADAETGAYIWADRYNRAAGNALDLEDEILGRIVNAVRRALVMREADRPGEISNAARLIWRGFALQRMTVSRKSSAEAARLFERALEIAPGSVSAKIGLANALVTSAVGPFRINNIDSLRRARDLIDGALAAAPNSAGAHYAKAYVLQAQGDCQDAIGDYEMTIALDRNATNAYALLGFCKLATGAFGDVVPLEERAIGLDPLDPFLGGYYARMGIAELFQSRIDQAISLFEKARSAHATRQNEWVYYANSWLAAAYALNGDTGRAADALAEARKSSEYPASIAEYRRRASWLRNPNVAAWADATYFKGLHLAGLPEE
ncbi:MAG: winged helix-turn-helix domain-containing protein [Hyphomicrobiales bacterium]|nr:winged helix-turn-helix domain-containing protein [Hyphomicrobiales bacterium]